MSIGWNFPRNNYGQICGIGEAGVETFRGTPFKSLAREICQNSLDARVSDTEPVVVEFSSFEISGELFPEREILDSAFKRCREFWKDQTDTKTRDFFNKASATINDEEICFLRISDFNTTGLCGSDKELNTDWCNLVKASGVSDKPGSAGGSFGIGKSAPFACSKLRTVFYSTIDKYGLRASQGVARLVSFKIDDEITQGIGYYGNTDRNTPIYDCFQIDSSFRRTTSGTDIYIAGFTDMFNWEKEVLLSILEGFLVAIWKGSLKVRIGSIEVSKDNLPYLIEKYKEELGITANYYDVLTSPERIKFEQDFSGHGLIELYLLIKPNMHRKVAITRNSGMKIFDKGSISSYIPFAGVLVLEGKDVNSLFRAMETPQHDKWEYERHPSPKIAKLKLKELFEYIREQLKSMEVDKIQDNIDAEGVGEYLPDEMETELPHNEQDKEEAISNRTKEIEITIVERTPKSNESERIQSSNAVDEIELKGEPSDYGDAAGIQHTGKPTKYDGGQGTPGLFEKNEKGTQTIKKLVVVKPTHLRLFCTNKNEGRYSLIFTPNISAKECYVSIELSGEQSNSKAQISKAFLDDGSESYLKCTNGKIKLLDIIEKQLMKIVFYVDYNEYCSMEVSIYGCSL